MTRTLAPHDPARSGPVGTRHATGTSAGWHIDRGAEGVTTLPAIPNPAYAGWDDCLLQDCSEAVPPGARWCPWCGTDQTTSPGLDRGISASLPPIHIDLRGAR